MANEKTREKILEVSLKLFSEKGYDGVGVQEIADECSLTKPSLYYYFKSKAGILEGIMTEYIDPFIEKLRNVCLPPDSIEEALKNFAYCYVDNCSKNLSLYMMMMTMQYSPLKSEFNNAFMKHCSIISRIVIDLFKREEVRNSNMKGRENQFANTLLGMLGFHIYTLRTQKEPRFDKKEVDLLIHQFLYGIFS